MDNSDIIIFKAITELLNDLNTCFGSKQKSIALYNRLVSKTTFTHNEIILKHIDKFRIFCIANREALQNKNIELLKTDTITYSSNVYINVKHILNIADMNERIGIWRHLLTISALVDKESKDKVKEILKGKNKGCEQEFIQNAYEDIKKTIDSSNVDQSNPMAGLTTLLQSGVFSNIMTGLTSNFESGNMDLSSLLGTVMKMSETLQKDLKEEAKNTVDSKEGVKLITDSSSSTLTPNISSSLSSNEKRQKQIESEIDRLYQEEKEKEKEKLKKTSLVEVEKET